MATPDYIDVIKDALTAAGISDVTRKLPDATKKSEAVMVFPTEPVDTAAYFDVFSTRDLSATVLVKRESDAQAEDEAWLAADTLKTADLASRNGTYRFTSAEVGLPRPLNWDESGFYVWIVTATIHE